MSVLEKLNHYRKNIMPKLTKDIGKNHFEKKVNLSKKTTIKRILIARPNQRLGNLLLTTPLLQEVTLTFPDAKIDIIVKGDYLAPIVFKNYDNIDKIIALPKKPFDALLKYARVWLSVRNKKYDLAINAVKGSSSGKLLTKMARANYKIFGEFEEEKQYKHNDRDHIAKNPIYNLRHYLKRINTPFNNNELPSLKLKLEPQEIAEGKRVLNNITKNNKETIAIFTYATGAKCYSKEWWLPFYEKLKSTYPDFNIIEVLPIENCSQINFKAPSFYSKDVREIAALLSNTVLFIGADSGIMHLSSAAQIQTIGLFSYTDPLSYGPYGNKSISIKTNGLSPKKIIEKISIRNTATV